jgi:hypothetical protein
VKSFKSVLKPFFRPVARRFVYPRIDQRIRVVIDEQSMVARTLPILLNHAESFAAAERENKRAQLALDHRVEDLERRMEFVRREILFELRRGGDRQVAPDAGVEAPQEPRIVNQGKLRAAGDDVRLNLGCGHIPLEGFLNVDARELNGVDIVANVHKLPFEADSVSQIHSAHLLEHFPLEDLKRTLLPYWYSLIRPGGEFSAIVPDAETMFAEYAAGNLPFEDLRRVTYGEQEYEGNFHFNMFSHDSLCECLREVGFVDVSLVASGRRNGVCYEMEVRAKKPLKTTPVEPGVLEPASSA